MAVNHIDAIHKHTQDLMRCLVHSPFLKMSQIMTFLITNQMPLEAQQVLSLQVTKVTYYAEFCKEKFKVK